MEKSPFRPVQLDLWKLHTGDHVPKRDKDARLEDVRASSSRVPAPAREPCDPDPQLVTRVNALIDCIGQCRGSFEKRVTASDIAGQQNRLMLVKEHVRELVLPLLRTGDNPGTGIEVKTFNTKGKTYPMRFKLWCSKLYVLTSDWKVFVRENELGVSDVLTIWVFSDVRTRELCFVIGRRMAKDLEHGRTEKGLKAKDGSAAS
ncbi:hypothetical protein NL676_005629 [Syzygium grande]|nr:hypothetical protein NL676_005629 [Syzygium grande]